MARTAPTQTVQQIALAELRPHPRNYQKHPPEQITKLAASLKRFGQRKNIVVWQQPNFFYVVAGHGLVEAAQTIKLPALLANVFPPETPEDEVIGYMVADNETARWAEPDLAQLEALLQAQLDAGYPLESVGYTLDELEALQQQLEAEAHGQRRAIDDPGGGGDDFDTSGAETRCKPGDLWQLGTHRLLCGDSTKQEDVQRLMDGERAQAVVTDSPYGIEREGITNDNEAGLKALLTGVLAYLPVDDGIVVNFQSTRLFPIWLDALRSAGQHFERMLWMYKPSDVTFPWRGWLLTSEAILLSTIGKPVWNEVHPFMHDTYSPTTLGKELPEGIGWHAAVKPLAIVLDVIQRVSPDDASIYDPFMGSGTTLIACERLARRCYGIEIEPRYCDVILARWEAETGETAVRL